jgi:acyl dehydratase
MSNPFALDFDELEGGERFVTRGRTITESDVVSFAGLTGDFHPQHTDAAWAAGSRFGERIAHGMMVMSYAIGLVPLDPEGRIESVTQVDDEHGLIESTWKVVTQRERTALRARVEILSRRVPVPAAELSELVMPL